MTIEAALVQAAAGSGSPPFDQTFSAPSLTQTPKIAIFSMSYGTALDTPVSHLGIGLGFCTATDEVGLAFNSEDSAADVDSGRRGRSDATLGLQTPGGNTFSYLELAFKAFTSTGVTVTHQVNPNSTFYINCLLLAGSDLDVAVGTITLPTGVSNTQSVTGLSFQPEAGLIYQTVYGTGSSDMIYAKGGFTYLDSTIVQKGFASRDNNGDASHNIGTVVSNSYAVVLCNTSGGLAYSASVSAVSSGGFTLTGISGSSSQTAYYLALSTGNSQVYLTDYTCRTSAGTQSLTGMGFQPIASLVNQTLVDEADDPTEGGDLAGSACFGFLTDSDEGCVRYAAEDAAATTNTESETGTDVISLTNDTGGNQITASGAMVSDGIDLTWSGSTFPSTGRWGFLLAIGPATSVIEKTLGIAAADGTVSAITALLSGVLSPSQADGSASSVSAALANALGIATADGLASGLSADLQAVLSQAAAEGNVSALTGQIGAYLAQALADGTITMGGLLAGGGAAIAEGDASDLAARIGAYLAQAAAEGIAVLIETAIAYGLGPAIADGAASDLTSLIGNYLGQAVAYGLFSIATSTGYNIGQATADGTVTMGGLLAGGGAAIAEGDASDLAARIGAYLAQAAADGDASALTGQIGAYLAEALADGTVTMGGLLAGGGPAIAEGDASDLAARIGAYLAQALADGTAVVMEATTPYGLGPAIAEGTASDLAGLIGAELAQALAEGDASAMTVQIGDYIHMTSFVQANVTAWNVIGESTTIAATIAATVTVEGKVIAPYQTH